MAVRIPNWTQGASPSGPVPRLPDQRPYRFEMLFNGLTERAYADTADELLGFLLPGYEDLSEAEQTAARLKFAVHAQVIIQVRINHDFGLSLATPDERSVLVGHRNTPPVVGEWSSAVPLVLVDAFYQPFGVLSRPATDVAAPDNVLWLSPGTPYDLLVSLHGLRFLIVNEHADHHA